LTSAPSELRSQLRPGHGHTIGHSAPRLYSAATNGGGCAATAAAGGQRPLHTALWIAEVVIGFL